MRRLIAPAALTLGAVAALPASASAHGLAGRTDLPLPGWIFAWGAGVVLVLSFVALSTLWQEARLEHRHSRRLFTIPAGVSIVTGTLGVAAYAGLVYSGFAGSQEPLANILPTFVFVVFWVAVPVLSVVFGDVFRAFNPWLALGRAGERVTGRERAPLTYPERLGRWPAALGLLAFAWLELVYADRDHPAVLAGLAVAYMLVQLMGMALFGVRTWSDRADPFGVYFSLAARLSPLEVRDGRLRARVPLSGMTQLDVVPGTTAIVTVLIGTTSFDGASQGLWKQVGPSITRGFEHLGPGNEVATQLAGTVGLLAAVGLVSWAYLLGVKGISDAVGRKVGPGRFAHSLAPIALAYVLAHYFSLVMFQGQAMFSLISDPLGDGSDLLGTASSTINYSVVSTTLIWWVQVAALVAGHVGGLILAHDRALVLFRGRAAVRSQYWMLAVMVGFTSLGLWLLSTVSSSS